MALDPFSAIVGLIETGVNKIFPDKTEADRNKFTLLSQELTQGFQLLLEQIKVNLQEAAHGSLWVAGWRPFIGWACGAGFAWTYVVAPICNYVLVVTGHTPVQLALGMNEMMPVVMGMLGLAAYRTYEKKNDLQDKH